MAWVLLLQTGAVGGVAWTLSCWNLVNFGSSRDSQAFSGVAGAWKAKAIIINELGKGIGNPDYARSFWSFLCPGLWAIVMIFPLQYLLLGVMADILVLEEQFKQFSIQKSQCFCCTSDHRHPDTGETLMCDRKFVYEAVRTWYKFDTAGEDETWEHFEKFDQVVRTTLRRRVMEGANNAILPFRMILYLAVVVTAPNLVELMTLEVEEGFGRPDLVYWVWRVVGWTSYVWVRILVSILVDIGVSIKLSKWCSRFLKSMSRLKVAAVASVLQFLLAVITLGAIRLCWDLLWDVDGSDWFPLVMAAWLFFITWFYGVGPCGSLCRWSHQRLTRSGQAGPYFLPLCRRVLRRAIQKQNANDSGKTMKNIIIRSREFSQLLAVLLRWVETTNYVRCFADVDNTVQSSFAPEKLE